MKFNTWIISKKQWLINAAVVILVLACGIVEVGVVVHYSGWKAFFDMCIFFLVIIVPFGLFSLGAP